MADEINPRIRTFEGAACEYVYTGLVPATSGTLSTTISAGTAYPQGYRINKASSTAKTYTASKWTYTYIDFNGDFQYQAVSIGAAVPSTPANSIVLARVSSDATTINTVTDLRRTSCTNGPFSVISDAASEADLGDILSLGSGGWENGLSLVSTDANTITIQAGTAYINGKYRRVATTQAVPGNVTASPSGGTSGLDSGALAANTQYYVYGVADQDGEDDMVGVLSTNASTPGGGAVNYRRLGEAKTIASSASFATADTFSISYMGKVKQVKYVESGAVETGATAIPSDDTVPQTSEGDAFYTLTITPTNANSQLYIDGLIWAASSAGGFISACVERSPYLGQFICGEHGVGDANIPYPIPFHGRMVASTTSTLTFRVRVGSGGTTTVNGYSGGRILGGSFKSYFRITEVEQ